MQFDLPLSELEAFRPAVREPDDFDDFWETQLVEAAFFPTTVEFTSEDLPLSTVDVFDVTFSGHANAEIRGWLTVPRHHDQPLPAIVEYIGYGGGRGLPHEALLWSAAGYAHFRMDTRGQGSGWSVGASADPHDPGEPSVPGFLTRGVLSPPDYYYVRLFVDAVRAIDAVATHEAVDASRLVVNGGSQGGGLALAAANLADGVVAAMIDVPFLANFERAVQITDAAPYSELARYCSTHRDKIDRVFHTLSYVDVVNHAKRTNVPGLFSVALADEVTPPSTVFSAYNWYAGPKSIEVYPYNGHEGGGAHHDLAKLAFAAEVLGS